MSAELFYSGDIMYQFQSIANKFAALFSLEFLWLRPFWKKPEPLGRWEDVKEATPSEKSTGPEFGRILIGFIVTITLGVAIGVLCSLVGIQKILTIVPFSGLLLFLWARFREDDNYSLFIGETCLVVGILWGIGALLGTFLA